MLCVLWVVWVLWAFCVERFVVILRRVRFVLLSLLYAKNALDSRDSRDLFVDSSDCEDSALRITRLLFAVRFAPYSCGKIIVLLIKSKLFIALTFDL